LWINLGPLQYHWADAHTYMEPDMADSIEIPLEDVERIAGELGFKTLRREVVFAGFNTDLRCGRRSELAIPRGSARR
jgi:carnosine N-methyltransferase